LIDNATFLVDKKYIDTMPLGNASLVFCLFLQNNRPAAPDERWIMDQEEILAFIMEVETEDIDPVCVAKVYAAAVDDMQSRISAQDMRRLLLVGAAMFRNSIKGKHAELQLPTSSDNEDGRDILENEPFKGILH